MSGMEGRQPVHIHPADSESLQDWLESHHAEFDRMMSQVGAILFRGFGPFSVAKFQRSSGLLCGPLFSGNPEHTAVSEDGTVQTPVPYASTQMLLWHNENSFHPEWPLRIAFCAIATAASGGETPIVDSTLIFRGIDREIRQEFERKQVCYIRNYASKAGVDWRTVFQTSNRQQIDAYCRSVDIEPEWNGLELVRTTTRKPAVIAHPVSRELSWFNQAHHWHPACLDPAVRDALERSVGSQAFPRHCMFGDGTPIPAEYMHHILDVYRRNQVVFGWRRGDVLVLDNVMWAHGRNPYQGNRSMLVALGSPCQYPARVA
jgi:alpha-ketoglutarate-dependent taurine dioxygenase